MLNQLPHPTVRRFRMVALWLACCGPVACTKAPNPGAPLSNIKVPFGADLSGVKGVDVSISVAPGTLSGSGVVDLVRRDDRVIYTAAIRAGQLVKARVVLPTKDNSLTARLRRPGGPVEPLALTISQGAAEARFR